LLKLFAGIGLAGADRPGLGFAAVGDQGLAVEGDKDLIVLQIPAGEDAQLF
jgi:hypothetical protein